MNKSIREVHQWSSGRIVPCHGTDPGSIPGWCMWVWAMMYNVFSIDGSIVRHRSQIDDVEHDSELFIFCWYFAIKKSCLGSFIF